MNLTRCFKCKIDTDSKNPKIVNIINKKTKLYQKYMQSNCVKCDTIKLRFVSNDTPLDLTEDKIFELIKSKSTNKKTNDDTKSGSSITNEQEGSSLSNEDLAVVTSINDDIDPSGEGFLDFLTGGKKEDPLRSATKSLIGKIPIVGSILNESGLSDKGIDWLSSNVFTPVRKWLGFSYGGNILDHIKDNDRLISELTKNMLEDDIKNRNSTLGSYISDLRKGDEEHKALAHVLLRTVTKPKFHKFLKDEKIPSDITILEAMTRYKSREKNYRNDEDKAIQILKGKGYIFE